MEKAKLDKKLVKNKAGDMRGKRGVDKKKRATYKVKFTDESKEYWNETLNLIEKRLGEYLVSDVVNTYLRNGTGGQPPVLTPAETVKRGLSYFRFALKYNRNMTVYGLSLHMGIPVATLMKMEANHRDTQHIYKNDIYRPIVKTLKSLIGLFHEELGTDKINPNFHIFVLKAMRQGFEEQVDFNVNTDPQGLSQDNRDKLRGKIKGFSESYTKKELQNG